MKRTICTILTLALLLCLCPAVSFASGEALSLTWNQGTYYDGKAVGSIADMTTFSFHPVKTVTGGEGGAVLTNSEELYQKLLLARAHGITRDADLLVNESHGPWYYEQIDLGYNYRITDIQCALGISQMKKLDSFEKTNDILFEFCFKALNFNNSERDGFIHYEIFC